MMHMYLAYSLQHLTFRTDYRVIGFIKHEVIPLKKVASKHN
jgi:hypothetical protein